MKKVYILFFLFLILFASFRPIQAVTVKDQNSSSPVPLDKQAINSERKEMLLELKQQVKTRVEDKKASVSAKLTEKSKVRVSGYWERLVMRLNATVDRLGVLIQRIESRLDTIEENNPAEDTSSIRTKLTDAKGKLTAAKAKLTALEEVVTEAIESESPKDAFVVVRNSVKEVKTMLVEAHTILVHVIGDIKGLRVGQDDLDTETTTPTIKPTATTTPTLTVTPTVKPTLTVTPTVTPTPTI